MKNTIALLSALLLATGIIAAQGTPAKPISDGIHAVATAAGGADTTYWSHKGAAGVNMSQAAYSNWSAGGDPSMAFDATFNFDLNYKRKKHLWTNRLELAYGLNNTKSNGTRKTNDKIFLSSSYGYELAKNFYLGAMMSFNTQFDKGYDYTVTPTPDKAKDYISQLMAPGYLNVGIGVIWTPKTWLKFTYSPVTWRGTFVMDDKLSAAGAFGVESGKRLLTQFGSDLVAEINTPIWKNIGFYSRLELYSNYLKNPENIIIHWDSQLTMKVNQWISAGINFNLIYDDNIKFLQSDGTSIPKLQIKEVLGIGLQATF